MRCQRPIELVNVRGHAVQQHVKVLPVGFGKLRLFFELPIDLLDRLSGHLPLVDRLQRQASGPAASGAEMALGDGVHQPLSLRSTLTISRAVRAASTPLLPAFAPARSVACSTLSVVKTPNATGMSYSSAKRERPRAHSPATKPK